MRGWRTCAARSMRICGWWKSRLDVEIRRRGDNFRVIGERAGSAEDTLRELFDLTTDEAVTPERVHLALREQELGRAAAGAVRR